MVILLSLSWAAQYLVGLLKFLKLLSRLRVLAGVGVVFTSQGTISFPDLVFGSGSRDA
jgi:hypothetical protein